MKGKIDVNFVSINFTQDKNLKMSTMVLKSIVKVVPWFDGHMTSMFNRCMPSRSFNWLTIINTDP